MSRHPWHWAILVLLLLALIGCGVRVEVGAPPTPPRPRATPTVDDSGVARLIATPRLVFLDPQTVQTQLFMLPAPADVYVLRQRLFKLTADYSATWFGSAQGNGRLRLTVYTRPDASQPWAFYNNVDRELSTNVIPADQHESLAIDVALPDLGNFEVRIDVEAVARADSGALVTRTEVRELRALVLSDPEPPSQDFAALSPILASPANARPLIDWRGWAGGPCALAEATPNQPGGAALRTACGFWSRQDLPGVLRELQDALGRTNEPTLRARLRDQVGLLALHLGQLDQAAISLGEAASAWQSADRASELTTSWHNQAVAWELRNEVDTASTLYTQAYELRVQMLDEPGRLITQANLGRIWGLRAWLRESATTFESRGLPQAAAVNQWLQQLDEKGAGQNAAGQRP